MRIAIILHGNLRTFFMPLRENPSMRLCDTFLRDIVNPNNADVFAFTDTNDFYVNGVQYYATNRRIEILNNNSYRLWDKVDFISNDDARKLINDQMIVLGGPLKALTIEDPFDATTDPKFNELYNANVKGSSPVLLIHQFRKLKLAYEMVKAYEQRHNFSYDIIVKWRFDISNAGVLKFGNYNYTDDILYVAGDHTPTIYDWHAFGRKKTIELCLNLYDRLGCYLHEGPVFMCDKCRYHGPHNVCQKCNRANFMSEITLAPEYHLWRIYRENNVRVLNSGYSAFPYRYKDTRIDPPITDTVKKLGIDATLVTYCTGVDIAETEFKKGN